MIINPSKLITTNVFCSCLLVILYIPVKGSAFPVIEMPSEAFKVETPQASTRAWVVSFSDELFKQDFGSTVSFIPSVAPDIEIVTAQKPDNSCESGMRKGVYENFKHKLTTLVEVILVLAACVIIRTAYY